MPALEVALPVRSLLTAYSLILSLNYLQNFHNGRATSFYGRLMGTC
jgi:hypothetical protein